MSIDTIITVAVSVVTSGITAFAIVAYRMGRYSEKIDQLEKCNLNTRISVMEGKIEVRQPFTQRKSPINLTDRGITVLRDSGGKNLIDENYNELKNIVEENNPKTSYDIQESSKITIEKLKDDERMIVIKEYLFKEGIEFEEIIDVLGIYLRNKILEEQHIAIEDIDKHNPVISG